MFPQGTFSNSGRFLLYNHMQFWWDTHLIGVMNALLVEPREVSTQLEQQTPILTMKSP